MTLRVPLSTPAKSSTCPPQERGRLTGFSEDGKYAVYADEGNVTVWSTETCDRRAVLTGFANLGSLVDYAGGAVVAAMRRTVVLPVDGGGVRLGLPSGSTWIVPDAECSVLQPSGERVVLQPVAGPGYPGSQLLAISPDGSWVAVAVQGVKVLDNGDHALQPKAFDTRTGQPIFAAHPWYRGIMAAAITSDGTRLRALTGGGSLLTCQVNEPEGVETFAWLDDYVRVSMGLDVSSTRETNAHELGLLRGRLCAKLTHSTSHVARAILGRLTQLEACAVVTPDKTR